MDTELIKLAFQMGYRHGLESFEKYAKQQTKKSASADKAQKQADSSKFINDLVNGLSKNSHKSPNK